MKDSFRESIGVIELKVILKYQIFLIRRCFNTIGLSRHEQVCLSGLHSERYFSHHRPDDGRSISRNVAHLNILVHGVIIDQFIGLKSKIYSIKKIDGSESSTAKGVNIATEFNEFKDVLFNKKIIRHKIKRIQAKKHKIGTNEIDKISLSCFDDKRYVLDDGIHTLAYFHQDSHKFKKDCIN